MLSLRLRLQRYVLFAVACAAGSLAGCGNSCFVGYSVNGNGGVIIKSGNPPPTCTLNQAQGMVRPALIKTRTCQDCAPVAQIQHMLVVLRGVHLHSEGEPQDTAWVDVATDLAMRPQPFDLVGDSLLSIPVSTAIVPAGTYDAIRLRLVPDADSSHPSEESAQNQCGHGIANCLVMGDDRIEPLSSVDVFLPLTMEQKALIVLPDSTVELHIQLGARYPAGASVSGFQKSSMQIFGEAVAQRIAH